MAHGRYDLTEFEWKTIQPLLPNKPRDVPRVDDGVFSTVSFITCVLARPGLICLSVTGLGPHSSTASARRCMGEVDECHHRGP